LRMCKYEYACHINRITPKWSTNSFIIKTAHFRPAAYRTSTQMWFFFNSLYLFALSLCVVNSSPRWLFFAAVGMKSHYTWYCGLFSHWGVEMLCNCYTHTPIYIWRNLWQP
jgi:hypothetical protein